MNRLFRTHRSAETFSSLLEGGQRDDLDREHAELLELVGALRSTARAEARPAFVADLRERLMVAAETELTPAPARALTRADADVARLTIKPRRGARERRVGLALGTLAIMGATTSMAVASQGAIPGDTLYPLKRAIENTETGISRGDDAKGESMLGNASGRLDEVDKLSRSDKPDAQLIAQTLSTFTDQAAQAGDHLLSDYADHGNAASIEGLHAFAQNSVGTLSDLEATVPPGARDELLEAAKQVFALDALAANACPDCGEPLLELPAQLVNGVTGALAEATGALDRRRGRRPLQRPGRQGASGRGQAAQRPRAADRPDLDPARRAHLGRRRAGRRARLGRRHGHRQQRRRQRHPEQRRRQRRQRRRHQAHRPGGPGRPEPGDRDRQRGAHRRPRGRRRPGRRRHRSAARRRHRRRRRPDRLLEAGCGGSRRRSPSGRRTAAASAASRASTGSSRAPRR